MNDIQLTDHFALSEFMTPKVPEDYPQALIDAGKLQQLAERLEWLRGLAGVPGHITSAYRSPEHNAAIGGVDDSQHVDGDAADVTFLLIPLRMLATRVQASIDQGSAPAFGQVILYADKGHVHVSNPAAKLGGRNGQALFSSGLNADGTREYELLTDALEASHVPALSRPQTREGLSLPSPSSLASRSASPISQHQADGGEA